MGLARSIRAKPQLSGYEISYSFSALKVDSEECNVLPSLLGYADKIIPT